WECTEDKMKLTKGGKALYMHCLPADISSVSCKEGEVAASVFERYRADTYREAGYKPFIIAAMMLSMRFKNSAEVLEKIVKENKKRLS
ncbi:MAG: knotted carbamoyltransferase YgeW, partial [Bdellovibrionota bacterium]